MKRVLIIADITAQIKKFHTPYLKMLKKGGYEVHVASYGKEKIQYCDKHFNVPRTIKPFSVENLKAYKQIKKIIKENNYEFIHCHTLTGGILGRLAGKNMKNTKVIYTAYGFRFYKGAPIKNWLIYYPIEKYLSKYTDTLITINKEDYDFAKEKFENTNIKLVNGVGVKTNKLETKISKEQKLKILQEFGLNENDYVFLSVGGLNNIKNQIMQIDAIRRLMYRQKNAKLLIAGEGSLREYYSNVIEKYGLSENIKLIGYRKDIPNLLKTVDAVISTSKMEGLPVNIIEAMVACKPIIATSIRGHRDLLKPNNLVKNTAQLTIKMKEYINFNKQKEIYEIQKYKIENVIESMKLIYSEVTIHG